MFPVLPRFPWEPWWKWKAWGEYIVQDRPAQWVIDKYGENQIDIYFDNHEAASAFGLKQLNVYLKGEPEK